MRKHVTRKNSDAAVRELYGWTQEEVAALLDVTRSHLARHETGDRLLPVGKLSKWLEWIKFTHVDNGLEKAKAALLLPPTGTAKLLRRAGDCEWETQKLQRQLATAQKRYEQALNNMALCPHLLSLTPDTEENAGARRLLKLTLSIATGTQQSKGLELLALLQCKIDGLLHEAQRCREMAEELGQEKTNE